MRLFKRIKRKKSDQDGCDLTVGQRCELFQGGRHNCKKQDGLTCALFCEREKTGDCQYWCVLKVGQSCSKHDECLYEYCDENGLCANRKALNESCDKDQECFSFKCEQKLCAKAAGNPCDKKDIVPDPSPDDPSPDDPNPDKPINKDDPIIVDPIIDDPDTPDEPTPVNVD